MLVKVVRSIQKLLIELCCQERGAGTEAPGYDRHKAVVNACAGELGTYPCLIGTKSPIDDFNELPEVVSSHQDSKSVATKD